MRKKKFLLEKYKGKKIYDLGVHTRFSTLDGISGSQSYVTSAERKGYAALGITDHYNVQSFPEFYEHSQAEGDMKILYGCEMEMLDDEFPPYLLNFQQRDREKK